MNEDLFRDPLVARAHALAEEAHRGQLRKGDDTPAIDHPAEVARMLHGQGYGREVLAAALLHDVVEDCEVTLAEIERRFGGEVSALVAAMTADDSIADYDARKDDHRREVQWAGPPATTIYAADKLANLRALRAAYEQQGEVLGARFNAPLDVKLEHTRRDIEMLDRVRPTPPFVNELKSELEHIVHLRKVNL